MKRLRENWWLILGVVIVVALLVWAFVPTPVEVDVAAAQRGPLIMSVDREGKTRVRERYVVSSPLAGRLLRIDLHPGDPVVARKTHVAVIEPVDPALLDARARAQAEAQVQAAKARVKQATSALQKAETLHATTQTESARARRMWASRSISEQEYQAAQSAAQTAAAEVRSAEFAKRTAEFELEQAQAALVHTRPERPPSSELESFRFDVPAPINGVVLRVFQESATVVSPGMRLLEVGDPIDLECEVDVLSADAVKIQPGQRVILEHWGGSYSLEGRVRLREPSAFTKVSALGVEEQRVNIIIDLLDRRERRPTLGDGYRVEARIVTWESQDVLKVPSGALFRREGGWAVFGVERGRGTLRAVSVGNDNGVEAEILSGLKEGDVVILHPSDRVKPGVYVSSRSGAAAR